MTATDRCVRCGRPINRNAAQWTPTREGELCLHCLDFDFDGLPEADWGGGKWLVRNRFVRWFLRNGSEEEL